MITDEQVNKAYKPMRKAGYIIHYLGCVKDALEAYEQSKWNDTEKGLPTKTDTYITDVGLVYFNADEVVWYCVNTNGYPDYDIDVAYWQPLPTFKR